MAVGGQHKIQGRALRNRCKLCVAILLWPWSSFASAPARFWIFTLEFGSMGQFPSSILGGCECGGGDLAILDSAGRLTLLWILLAPPDLQNLTKWKAFLEVSHLRFLAWFRIQLRDLESLDSVFCDLVWSARARRQLRHAMLALCLGHANAVEDQISVTERGCVFACAAC